MLALLGGATLANAQLFTFGLKAGINTTTDVFKNVTINNGASDNWQIVKNNAKVGFQAGAFARVKLLGFYVQPEFYYSQSRTEITLSQVANGQTTVKNEINKLNTLNIPILVGYKFGPLRVNAGPVANIVVGNSNIIEDITGVRQSMKTANWGFQAGVGVDILKTLTFDARYEGSLSKLGSSYNTLAGSNVNFGSHPQQFIFTVGVFLF